MKYCIISCLLIFGYANSLANVNFSVQRGFFTDAFQLKLSTTQPNSTIIYTNNNSKPTLNNGLVYEGEPINIANTQTIKAISYNATDTSQVSAHTFIFLEDIIDAAYMDTSITKNKTYKYLISNSFFSLPIISVSSDIIKINDNFEPDVEISLELFDADSTTTFQVNCGIETWGGSKFSLKKHYRLEFKTQYGVDELIYPLFDDMEYPIKPVQKFNRLLLRSGSQDGLNGEFCDEAKALFIRNRVMMDVQMQMGYPAPHGRFVHLLFNQQYQGVYHLMERPDQDFFKAYYFNKMDKKEIEVRKNNDFLQQPHEPTLYSQLDALGQKDLTDWENFSHLKKLIDLEQTATYLLLNDYGGNFDWSIDRNNLGAATAKHPYKFILWDVDLTIDNEGVFEETYGDQLHFNSLDYTGPIPKSIFKNETFRLRLADAMQCHCFVNGALHPQQMNIIFNQRANQIEKALIAESARWGNVDFEFNGRIGHQQKNNWDVNDEWIKAKNSALNFIEKRTDTLIAQYTAAGIFPALHAVQFFLERPTLQNEEKIELKNPNEGGDIYYTNNGQDPRNFNAGIAETAILYTAPFSIERASTIQARVYANGIWSAMCPKKYYLKQSYADLIINEMHYQPLDSVKPDSEKIAGKHFEFIEVYNKGTDAIDLAEVAFTEGVQYQFKNQTTIEPKQFLILASDSLRFVERYNFPPFGTYKGHLSNEGETVRLQNPQAEIIVEINYGLDDPWPSAFNQFGHSLSLKEVDVDCMNPVNWLYSKELGGTPGHLNFIKTSVQFNENSQSNFIEYLINPHAHQLVITSKKHSNKKVQIYNTQNQLRFTHTVQSTELISIISYSFLPKGLFIFVVHDEEDVIVGKLVR